MRLSAPRVVASDSHHTVIDEQVDQFGRLGIAVVTLLGIFGTLTTVVTTFSAIERFEGIVRNIEFQQAVGDD